jgi:hypothetical protein
MERVGDRWKKMEGHCSTGLSPQRAVEPMEEEEEKYSATIAFWKMVKIKSFPISYS